MRRLAAIFTLLAAVGFAYPASADDVVDHEPFSELLETYVDDDGQVAYEKLKDNEDDAEALQSYLNEIAEADPEDHSSKARLAFWLNSYNAAVIQSVLDHWPMDNPQKVDGFFDGEKHKIAGKKMTLNELEHGLIREEFDEPRIHFVLVCAAKSCPRLRRTALTGDNLEQILESAAQEFIPQATDRSGDTVTTSEIFKWFSEDFEEAAGSLRAYLAKYTDGEVKKGLEDDEVDLEFRTYDWSLNSQ